MEIDLWIKVVVMLVYAVVAVVYIPISAVCAFERMMEEDGEDKEEKHY